MTNRQLSQRIRGLRAYIKNNKDNLSIWDIEGYLHNHGIVDDVNNEDWSWRLIDAFPYEASDVAFTYEILMEVEDVQEQADIECQEGHENWSEEKENEFINEHMEDLYHSQVTSVYIVQVDIDGIAMKEWSMDLATDDDFKL